MRPPEPSPPWLRFIALLHRPPLAAAALQRSPHSLVYGRSQLGMAGHNPPYFLNTEDDRGDVVAGVTFTFAVVATFTNGIRVWIRQRKDGALGLDDAFLVAANVSVVKRPRCKAAAETDRRSSPSCRAL